MCTQRYAPLTVADDHAPTPGLTRRALAKLILFYQYRMSPLKMGSTCRFEPTCSAYALATVQHRSPWIAVPLIVARIAKCGPWHPGGFDPPPGWDEPPLDCKPVHTPPHSDQPRRSETDRA